MVAVALYFASAYDTIDEVSMLAELESEVMDPKTLALLKVLMMGFIAKVRVGGRESEVFTVHRGVRQGSVLSPVLFVTLMDWVLSRALNDVAGAVCVGRHGNLSDFDYADDVLLLTTSLEAAQMAIMAVAKAGSRVGLELNPKKTIWMASHVGEGSLEVGGLSVSRSATMVYLGCEMRPDGSMDGELHRRLVAANASFWKLRRLWRDRGVSVKTKARVYSAVVRGTLLYGAETWPMKVRDLGRMGAFDRARLRWVAGIKWPQKISSEQLMSLVDQKPVEKCLIDRRWRWLGHVLRMDENRWPRRLLMWSGGEEHGARRNRGGQKLTWIRQVVREGWDLIPWKLLGVRKPHWIRWAGGDWRGILLGLSEDRDRWRTLVRAVVNSSGVARDGRVGSEIN